MEDSSGSIGRGKNKRYWTPEEDKALITSLIELNTDPHWKCENGFRNGYMHQLQLMIEKKIPGCGLKAMPHIDSRLKTITIKYRALYKMASTSGFTWNDEKNMIQVDREVYDGYCKIYPAAKNMYGVSFPYFHDLEEVLGKDYATGKRAEGFEDALDNLEKEGSASMTHEAGEEGDNVESAPPTKKLKRRKGNESMANGGSDLSVLQTFMHDVSHNLSSMATAWTRSQDALIRAQEREEEMLEKAYNVMDELLNVEGLSLDQVIEAATVLSAEPNKLRVFDQCHPTLRKRFVLRIISSTST